MTSLALSHNTPVYPQRVAIRAELLYLVGVLRNISPGDQFANPIFNERIACGVASCCLSASVLAQPAQEQAATTGSVSNPAVEPVVAAVSKRQAKSLKGKVEHRAPKKGLFSMFNPLSGTETKLQGLQAPIKSLSQTISPLQEPLQQLRDRDSNS